MIALLMLFVVTIIIGIIIQHTKIINETTSMIVLTNQITNDIFGVNVAHATRLVIIQAILVC